jgi:hypothetical protein
VDIGADRNRAFLVTMDLGRAGFSEAGVRDVFTRAAERLEALPGVESAAINIGTAPTVMANLMTVRIPGRDTLPRLALGGPYFSAVGAGFFPALGTDVQQGRNFTPAETRAGSEVAIINRTLADAWWPDESPIERCVHLGNRPVCTTIVGIVEDVVLFRMIGETRAQIYIPLAHALGANRAPSGLVVRTAQDGGPSVALMRQEIQGLAPNMPHVSIRSFGEIVGPELRPWTLGASLFTTFGALAIIIASVGLYSLVAFFVTQRRDEIGIRLALGADARSVAGLVLGQGMRLVATGLMIGTVLTLGLAPRVAPLLFGVSARDPLSVLASAALFAIIALLALLGPALRAARVNPSTVMRAD